MDEFLDTTVKSFPTPSSNLVTRGSNSANLASVRVLNQIPIPQPIPVPPKDNIWLSTFLPLITLFIFLILPSVVAITAINLNHNNVSINVTVPPVNQPSLPPIGTPPVNSKPQQTIVQLGSYRSIAEAKSFMKKLKINDAIDISQLHIYKSTLPTGVWFRVALMVSDVNVGNDMCNAYKALGNGNDCLVLTLNVA